MVKTKTSSQSNVHPEPLIQQADKAIRMAKEAKDKAEKEAAKEKKDSGMRSEASGKTMTPSGKKSPLNNNRWADYKSSDEEDGEGVNIIVS